MDYVLSFHIGLAERVIARQARSARTGDEEKDRLRVAWRKWEQAAHACDEAEEAEEFQAVAMRCRESLLALIHAVSTDAMVPDGEQPPKRSDFVQWTGYIAAAVTPSAPRLRAYLRKVAAGAWDLVNWLTHAANADRVDATIAVDATAYTLDLFGVALLRHERGGPRRCPKCGSYRLATDWRFEDDVSVTLCKACEWRSEPHPKRRPAP